MSSSRARRDRSRDVRAEYTEQFREEDKLLLQHAAALKAQRRKLDGALAKASGLTWKGSSGLFPEPVVKHTELIARVRKATETASKVMEGTESVLLAAVRATGAVREELEREAGRVYGPEPR